MDIASETIPTRLLPLGLTAEASCNVSLLGGGGHTPLSESTQFSFLESWGVGYFFTGFSSKASASFGHSAPPVAEKSRQKHRARL